MWPARREVECVACGSAIARTDAREYDKYGDRWERAGKEFEHLCKPCDRDLCRHQRAGLESLLIDLEAGENGQREFLRRYCRVVEQRAGDRSVEES